MNEWQEVARSRRLIPAIQWIKRNSKVKCKPKKNNPQGWTVHQEWNERFRCFNFGHLWSSLFSFISLSFVWWILGWSCIYLLDIRNLFSNQPWCPIWPLIAIKQIIQKQTYKSWIINSFYISKPTITYPRVKRKIQFNMGLEMGKIRIENKKENIHRAASRCSID